ncbi:MAG: NUDIX hydrolase [Phyllobacteriaceae bacterium]|jgi:8-oxo-dGTP pyrophosphatase MutT (NUDIX family)|nr:NUDIX hydrolase [Phyllobacteriaceae bacterium]
MSPRPHLRPRNAASLLLADMSDGTPAFLMGERSGGHVFMAHNRVFPGGRVEKADSQADVPPVVPDQDMAWLRDELGADASDSRATAFAACALREAAEETGLVLDDKALLTPLRYMARAITPPGQVRRYDTRFFLAVVDRNQVRFEGTDGELSAIGWYPSDTDHGEQLHAITAEVMRIATARLADDPPLETDPPVPCYRVRNGRRIIEYPATGWFP